MFTREKAVCVLFILALFVCAVVLSIAATVFIIKKHRLKQLFIILVTSCTTAFVCLTLYYCAHGKTLMYNDWWVVGNEVRHVEERYGEFDYGKFDYGIQGEVAYSLGWDRDILISDDQEKFYYIEYNEKGIVTKVYVGGPYGG